MSPSPAAPPMPAWLPGDATVAFGYHDTCSGQVAQDSQRIANTEQAVSVTRVTERDFVKGVQKFSSVVS